MRFLLTASIFCLVLTWLSGQQDVLTVMSYNLRYDEPRDSADNWHQRKAELVQQVKACHPDILGIQEGLLRQLTYIDSSLVNHVYVGAGRDDGKSSGEFSALFYDTLRLMALEHGTFWLSPTPEKPSKGWDAALPRVCTFALLMDKRSGKKFWAFNTHFDHLGKEARKNSASLITNMIRIKNRKNFPVILMGDLNCTPEEAPAILLRKELRDTWQFTRDKDDSQGTFNGFGRDTSGRRIDYIFVRKLKVKSYSRPDTRRSIGRFISDHFPVMATLKI